MTLPDIQPWVTWMMQNGPDSAVDSFARLLRGSFFTGFLTLGSLVTAAMNYTLSTLKAGIYDRPEYQAYVKRLLGDGPGVDPHAPLKRLSSALYRIIVLSFLTSFLQITAGLFPYNWAAVVCIGMAIVTMLFVMWGLHVMGANLKDWQRLMPGQLPGAKGETATSKPKSLLSPRKERTQK